jgi:hypothetical protein
MFRVFGVEGDVSNPCKRTSHQLFHHLKLALLSCGGVLVAYYVIRGVLYDALRIAASIG